MEYGLGLTASEVKELMISRGYTHVKTYGGELAILEWNPYGGHADCLFDEIADDTVEDAWKKEGYVAGIWDFVKN